MSTIKLNYTVSEGKAYLSVNDTQIAELSAESEGMDSVQVSENTKVEFIYTPGLELVMVVGVATTEYDSIDAEVQSDGHTARLAVCQSVDGGEMYGQPLMDIGTPDKDSASVNLAVA